MSVKNKDKSLPSQERITRLSNLSRNYLNYFRKHKEVTIALVSSYNELMDIYQDLPISEPSFIGQPLNKEVFSENPYLSEIKRGVWLETNSRAEAELIEFNNHFLAFLSSLLGIKNPQ